MHKRICLCMIVKNEAPVIQRCIQSILPIIDCWVIVDTGSTDGTQNLVQECLNQLPGELVERPWINFAHNRTEALEYARGKADFVFIIDADEVLEFDHDFAMPELTADAYQFSMRSGGMSYYKTQLVRDSLNWCFKGVVHEYIHTDHARIEERMTGVRTLRFPDGARARDPLTYRRDALLLEEGLLNEPGNARYMFYLAQSYADAKEPALAIDRYKKRVAMGGWIEEVWYSLYQIARLKEKTDSPWAEVMADYLAAYATRPERAEPLYQIGFHYQAKREFALAHLFFSQAMQIPFPEKDMLFVEKVVYDALLPLEYSVACFYVGQHTNSIRTCNQMLLNKELPSDLIERVISNRQFSLDILHPKKGESSGRNSQVIVVVPFLNPGHYLDNCVESLLNQEGADFRVVFVDQGSSRDYESKIPLEDSRFHFIQGNGASGWQSLVELALDVVKAELDSIVISLNGLNWFSDTLSISNIVNFFETYDCEVMYGQYRYTNGRLGEAMPLSCSDDLANDFAHNSIGAVAFRRIVLTENTKDSLDILRAAGFSKVRFLDTPTQIWNLDQ
jgi:glycosyltransferase involved in cell wall biosynthesis